MVSKATYYVSIILPIYNNEENLVECLNSILDQTMIEKIEIICVDDGSNDNSHEILQDYAKKNNNFVLLTQINHGAGIARNAGIKAAQGQYVMFVDGDDFFAEKDSVEKLYNAISDSGLDVCFGNMLRLYNDRLVKKFEAKRKYSNFKFEGIIKTEKFAYPFIHFLCIYRRTFLIENGLRYPDRRRGQDVVFCADVLRNTHEVMHINYPIYVHRVTKNKRVFEYNKAVDYVLCMKEIIEKCETKEMRKKYALVAGVELRVFAMIGWYRQVDDNNEWNRVDEINALLSGCGVKTLLEKDNWERHGIAYWKEYICIYIYRVTRFLQKKIYYFLYGSSRDM